MSYYDATAGALRYRSSLGATQVLDAAADPDGYSDLVVDDAGYPHVAWVDATRQEVRHATNADGSWVTNVVSSGATHAPHVAVAIDGDGTPRLLFARLAGAKTDVYMGWDSGAPFVGSTNIYVNSGSFSYPTLTNDLMLHGAFHAGTPTGGSLRYLTFLPPVSSNVATVETGTGQGVGLHASVLVLPSHHPLIAHYDAAAKDLRVATREKGFWESTIAVAPGAVGEHASAVLGTDHQGRGPEGAGSARCLPPQAPRPRAGGIVGRRLGSGDLDLDLDLNQACPIAPASPE